MLTVPLSGFLGSILGRGIVFFGLPLPPLLVRDREVSRFCNEAQELLIWGLAALAASHVMVALWHAIVRRDGTLQRLLPGRPAARPPLAGPSAEGEGGPAQTAWGAVRPNRQRGPITSEDGRARDADRGQRPGCEAPQGGRTHGAGPDGPWRLPGTGGGGRRA